MKENKDKFYSRHRKLINTLGIIFIGGGLVFHLGHTFGRLVEVAGEKNIDILFILNYVSINYNFFSLFDFNYTYVSSYFGAFLLIISFAIYAKIRNLLKPKKYRPGIEHGSAKFLTKEELKTFEDENPEFNMIFTQNAQMGLYNKNLPREKQMNKNVLVVGDSGVGKTYTYLIPNAMQLVSSYIFTDIKNTLVRELGGLFKANFYRVYVIDIDGLENSHQFNVFAYIKREKQIDEVALAIAEATSKSDQKGEDFWIQAELTLLKALLAYLYIAGKHYGFEPHLGMLNDLMKDLDREDPNTPSPTEDSFEALNEEIPNNYAYNLFQAFNKNFKSNTRDSVKAVIAARLSVFEHRDVQRLLERDTLNIDTWNTEKVAVFINIPEISDAYKFISALLFTTIFSVTIKTADDIRDGKIKKDLVHLQLYMDELAQIGKVPGLEKRLAAIRSREISAKLILQDTPQLDTIYGKDIAKTIKNNCASLLYLGTNDKETAEYLSFRAGNETILDRNISQNRNASGGGSTENNSKLKRELITAHEIMTIPITDALLYIGKQNVYRDKKYDPKTHKNSKYLAHKPGDKYWYDYKVSMNEAEDWVLNTRKDKLIVGTEEEVQEIFQELSQKEAA